MRRRSFPYYVCIAVALSLVFLAACGSQDGMLSGDGSRSVLAINASEDFALVDASDEQDNPAVAYSIKDGTYLLVWTDRRASFANGMDIYGRI